MNNTVVVWLALLTDFSLKKSFVIFGITNIQRPAGEKGIVGTKRVVDGKEVIGIKGVVGIVVLVNLKNLVVICYRHYY